MDDMIASIIQQANDLRKMTVHPDIAAEVLALLTEADSLVDDALHLADEFDPEA
jgi:hypothetical protein